MSDEELLNLTTKDLKNYREEKAKKKENEVLISILRHIVFRNKQGFRATEVETLSADVRKELEDRGFVVEESLAPVKTMGVLTLDTVLRISWKDNTNT